MHAPGPADFGPATYGDAFADVYDRWYADLTDTDSCVDAVARLAGTAGPVVELGVGTGRLAGPLAARGVPVVGVDASRAMLTRLATSWPGPAAPAPLASDAAAVAVRDACAAVVLVAYNTFLALASHDVQRAAVHEAARVLRPDGVLVIETVVPPDPDERPTSSIEVTRVALDEVVLMVSRQEADQVLVGSHVQLTEQGGVRLRPWRVRWLTLPQLDGLAEAAGLALAERWATWHGEPYDDGGVAISVFRHAVAGPAGVEPRSPGGLR